MKNKLIYVLTIILLIIFIKVSFDGYGFYNIPEENLMEHSENTFSEEELPVEFVKTVTANNTKLLIYKNAENVFVFNYVKSFFTDNYIIKNIHRDDEGEDEIRFMSEAPLKYNNVRINSENFEATIEEVPNNQARTSILGLIFIIGVSVISRRYKKKREINSSDKEFDEN